jgi:hypothetical protein
MSSFMKKGCVRYLFFRAVRVGYRTNKKGKREGKVLTQDNQEATKML